MRKGSILSFIVCVLLIVSYYLGGVNPDAYDTFKVVLECFGFIFIVSASYLLYERKIKKKSKQR